MGGPIVVRAAMTHSDLLQGVVSLAGSLAGALEPNEWFRGLYKVFPVNLLMAPPLRSSNDELFTHFRQLDAMQNDWQNISCPVFIFQGLSDNLVDKRNADYAEKKLAHLHQKEIIRMPGEDHFIPWTQEDVIAGYILKLADQ
jgi:pimeloyl-ACP methyl ester carboxylesterase